MRSYLAAAIQMTASASKEENLAKAETFVRLAAERGAALVVLPEVFSWRGRHKKEPEQVEPIPGPTTHRLRDLATQLGVHLLAGSFLEKSDEARAYNTSLLINPQGELLAQYRKIHLFDVDIPGQVSIKESASMKPGGEVVVASTPLGTIGLSVCYDLRFPRALPGALPQGRTNHLRAVGVYLSDRRGPLGSPAAGRGRLKTRCISLRRTRSGKTCTASPIMATP